MHQYNYEGGHRTLPHWRKDKVTVLFLRAYLFYVPDIIYRMFLRQFLWNNDLS